MTPHNEDKKYNFRRSNHSRNLQYAPTSRYEWATKGSSVRLPDGPNSCFNVVGFLMSVGEIMRGVPGAKECNDKQQEPKYRE